VLIRRASLADAAAIGSVWLRAALAGYAGIFPPEAPKPTAADLTERCRQSIIEGPPGATVLVACRGPGEAVTGTVAAVPDPDGAYRGYLRRLYVDPDHWGRGIGRRLHDAIVDHLRAGGSGIAALWVLEENVRARSMYERWTWRATPARRTAYPGVAEVRYVRTL
jgi:GNAT superfamily N-acetyltransferase